MRKLDVIGVIAGLTIFLLTVGQFDLLCSPYIWRDIHYREIFSLAPQLRWMRWSGDFYNLMMWTMGLGMLLFAFSLAGWIQILIQKLQRKFMTN
jgi:hypothetical protein